MKLYCVTGNLTNVCEISRYRRVTPRNAMENSDLEYNACSWSSFVKQPDIKFNILEVSWLVQRSGV